MLRIISSLFNVSNWHRDLSQYYNTLILLIKIGEQNSPCRADPDIQYSFRAVGAEVIKIIPVSAAT